MYAQENFKKNSQKPIGTRMDTRVMLEHIRARGSC